MKLLKFINIFFTAIVLIAWHIPSSAQISYTAADYTDTLHYKRDTSKKDLLFVIHSPDEIGSQINTIPGSLEAYHSDTTLSDFIWMKFDTATLKFDTIKTTDTSTLVSTLTNLEEGCYRVAIKDTSDSSEMYSVWMFIDHIDLAIREPETLKDSCNEILFDTYFISNSFYYYELYPDSIAATKDSIEHEMSSSVLKIGEGNDNIIDEDLEPDNLSLDLEDIKENVDVFYIYTDIFDNTIEGYYYYENWRPVIKDETNEPLVELSHTGYKDEDGYYAPDEVTFTITGNNFDSIMWFFGDTLTPGYEDDSVFTVIFPSNSHLYRYPTGEEAYHAKIVAKNNLYGCKDSVTFEIKVIESKIEEIPSVFTPNNDSQNDVFEIRGKSIKHFEIKIFDRWGRVVFKEKLVNYNAREDDEGVLISWDGTNRVTVPNRTAPPGIYYYIIEAEGYDGVKYGGKKNKSNTQSEGQDDNNNSSSSTTVSKKYPFAGYLYLFR